MGGGGTSKRLALRDSTLELEEVHCFVTNLLIGNADTPVLAWRPCCRDVRVSLPCLVTLLTRTDVSWMQSSRPYTHTLLLQAFNQKQKKLMMSWKMQIQKVWHPPPTNKFSLDKRRG